LAKRQRRRGATLGWLATILCAVLLFFLRSVPAHADPDASWRSPDTLLGAQLAADATVVSKDDIHSLLGQRVLSGKGQDMGQIVNVIVDHAGQPRAVVVDFGGFLGVGSRKIAVDWKALRFTQHDKSDQIVLDLTPDQLKAVPDYQEGKPVVVIVTSGQTQTLPPEIP